MTNPHRFTRPLRRVVLVLAVAGMGYLFLRYRIVDLPAEGCSPVAAVPPGSRLVVDTRWPRLWPDDLVLYRPDGGPLLFGLVRSAGGDGVWIESDTDDCPSPDSRELGPVPEDRVEARVLFVWPAGPVD